MMRTNLSTASRRNSTIISADEAITPGTELYDLHFEDFVVVRQILGSSLGVEGRGRYYCAPRAQFERLKGDVCAKERAA